MTSHTPPVPRLTVLMPVYNAARYLGAAIESILGQTFRDFEFLIVDDGSGDESPGIIGCHAAKDARIRVLRQENRGLIATLNRGFGEARGELIARMDADDLSRPDRLEKQVAFLDANPKIALVGGAIEVIDGAGRHMQIIRLPENPEPLRRHMRELGCALAHPTVCFRREAVLAVGGLRPAYRHAEDYDLWLRMLERYDFANLPDILLSYRRHEGSVSSRHVVQQVLSAFCARQAAVRRSKGKSDPTSDAPLVTPEVVLGLGIDAAALNSEMVRGLTEAVEMAVAQGRPSAAVEFLEMARPFCPPANLNRIALELNRKAARTPASREEQAAHRKLLLETDLGMYRDVFSGVKKDPMVAPGAPPVEDSPQLTRTSTLTEILKRNRYDTDKSEEYLRNYERTFGHLRNSRVSLLEIGVNRGGSLYLWRDYFPRGTVVGVDLAPPTDFRDEEGRCSMFQADQADAAALKSIAASSSPEGFHIIIDDASHLGALTAITFRTLFYDHLQPGGFYAIEDWGTGYWSIWPDGEHPAVTDEPAFPNHGKRFLSHDFGMVGFLKQLIDECALSDIFHHRFGLPRKRASLIRGMHVSPGLIIIEKARE